MWCSKYKLINNFVDLTLVLTVFICLLPYRPSLSSSTICIHPLLSKPQDPKDKNTRNPPWIQNRCDVLFFTNFFLRSPSLQGTSPAAPSAENKLVRTTRVRRQTPAGGQVPPTSSENQTVREQPLVFNHVYNINVPLESLCSVDLDSIASPSPADGQFLDGSRV